MLRSGQVIDRYTVDDLLGSGGMAVVYRVRHNQLGSFHALKVLTHASPGIRERLLQEGRVQASLRHPNVVTVTDVIDVDGAPGLVMEYVDGPSLDAWLAGHRPDLETAERLFRGIVAGVAAAHAQGLVHRDLKPANVLLARQSGGEMLPKVADFGLAKALFAEDGGLHATRSGVAMGTPAYMAPEQIRNAKNVDHRADVFSLGCLLFELVCGRPPFVGPDQLSIFNAVASGSFPPPASLVPDLPGRIHQAIDGALAVKKEQRIQDCTGLLYVLDGQEPEPPGGFATPRPATEAGATLAPAPGATFDADALAAASGSDAQEAVHEARGRWALLGLVLPLAVLFALGAALLTAGWLGASAWERHVRQAVAAKTDGQLTWKLASIRPAGVLLGDVVLLGDDGKPLAVAPRVRLGGRWRFRGGTHLELHDVEVDGLRLTLRRQGDAWVVPGRVVALLRARAGRLGVKLRRLATGPILLRATGSTGTLDGYIGGLRLDGVVLDAPGGPPWTAGDLSVGSVTLKAGAPVLQVKDVSYDAGVLAVDDLKGWVRVRQDGRLSLPPVVADFAPDWLGGRRHESGDDPWFGWNPGLLPVAPRKLEVTSGRLQLFDAAHAPSTQRWDLDLDRASLGPFTAPWLPLDAAGQVDGAPITIQADFRRDGMVRGRVGVRHLPVARFAPYMATSLRRLRVEPSQGTLSATVALTLKEDSFAGRLHGEANDVAFAPVQSTQGTAPPPEARALAPTRAQVPLSAQLSGSLADADFHPVDQAVAAVAGALLAPAGGVSPFRPPLLSPDGAGKTRRVIDRFRREVRDALDEYRPPPPGRSGPPKR